MNKLSTSKANMNQLCGALTEVIAFLDEEGYRLNAEKLIEIRERLRVFERQNNMMQDALLVIEDKGDNPDFDERSAIARDTLNYLSLRP